MLAAKASTNTVSNKNGAVKYHFFQLFKMVKKILLYFIQIQIETVNKTINLLTTCSPTKVQCLIPTIVGEIFFSPKLLALMYPCSLLVPRLRYFFR